MVFSVSALKVSPKPKVATSKANKKATTLHFFGISMDNCQLPSRRLDPAVAVIVPGELLLLMQDDICLPNFKRLLGQWHYPMPPRHRVAKSTLDSSPVYNSTSRLFKMSGGVPGGT